MTRILWLLPALLAAVLLAPLMSCSGSNGTEPQPEAASQDRENRLATAQRLKADAETLVRAGNYVEAASKLEQAADLAPLDSGIQEALADACLELRRYSEARQAFLLATREADGPRRARLAARAAHCSAMMANQAYTIGEDKLALEHLRDAMKDNANDYDNNMLLGYVQYRRKEFEEAAQAFRHAARLVSGARSHEALAWSAQSHFAGERYTEAADIYTSLIDNGVTAHDVYGWRAYCYSQMGRNEEARRDFNNAATHATTEHKRREYLDAAAQLAQAQE